MLVKSSFSLLIFNSINIVPKDIRSLAFHFTKGLNPGQVKDRDEDIWVMKKLETPSMELEPWLQMELDHLDQYQVLVK